LGRILPPPFKFALLLLPDRRSHKSQPIYFTRSFGVRPRATADHVTELDATDKVEFIVK